MSLIDFSYFVDIWVSTKFPGVALINEHGAALYPSARYKVGNNPQMVMSTLIIVALGQRF